MINVQKISALVITLNEEHNIAATLENIAFAVEMIVVDSYSTDATLAIANSFKKVKVYQNKFENYAVQRNFAISKASNSWILFIDADERIPEELKLEILSTVNNPNAVSAYLIYRTFMFKNSILRFSGCQTDKIYRLFQKDKALYDENKIVHEKLIINGKSGKLKSKLIHYSYNNYESYRSKMIFYGKLKAIEEYRKSTNPTFFYLYIRTAYQFLYQYFIRLGILDGQKGIIICYLNALSVYIRFKELRIMRQKNNSFLSF